MDALAPSVLCRTSLATRTQDRRPWIWIYPWISTQKSVDMDMDGKFHIHGKPVYDTTVVLFGTRTDPMDRFTWRRYTLHTLRVVGLRDTGLNEFRRLPTQNVFVSLRLGAL